MQWNVEMFEKFQKFFSRKREDLEIRNRKFLEWRDEERKKKYNDSKVQECYCPEGPRASFSGGFPNGILHNLIGGAFPNEAANKIKRTVRTVPERRRDRIIVRCGVLSTGAAFPHPISWKPKCHRLVWIPQCQTTARLRSTAGSRVFQISICLASASDLIN